MRKKYLLIIVILVVALCCSYFIYYLYGRRLKVYKDFSSYGSTQVNSETTEVVVEAFLESVEQRDKEDCFNLLTISEDQDSFVICSREEIIAWDNPYGSYDKWIPVSIKASFSRKLFSKWEINSLVVTLLEDDQYMFFYDYIDDAAIPNFNIYIKSIEDVKRKGYYISPVSDKENMAILTIREVLIEEIEVDRDEIIFYCNANINEEEIKLKIRDKYANYISSGDDEESSEKISQTNISNLDLTSSKQLSFLVEGDLLVEEYIEKLLLGTEVYANIDLDLILIKDSQE